LATVTSVPASVTEVTIVDDNENSDDVRRGVHIYNDSTADLYIKFGTGVSTESFTVKIPTNTFFESAQPLYRGIVTGIWSEAVGSAKVTKV
jgi:hypothetical protein